jgi:teichuronic acid biosynthesis glycosyltransferase TuaH
MSRERCYVVYAPTAWDSQRQPVHNFAEGLAAKHRVLYVDPPISPLSPVRYGFRASTWPRLQSVLRRRVRTSGRLQVFSPLVLPPIQHPRMRALSLPLLRAQIARAVAHVGFEDPIVIAARGMPELAGVAGESLRVAMIVDHPSAGATLVGRSTAELEAEAAALCESCEFVCVTSASIVDLLAQDGWHSEFIPAGFPADLAEAFDNAAQPAEYASLPRPLLGYTGGVDDRLDYDLILALADRYSHGSLVFVGAISPRLSTDARAALAARANIHLLGLRPRTELPGYIRHLDVALLPYQDSLFTRYQSPMKFWEYLYAGPPIVGAGSAELRRYQAPLVNYADSPDAALAMVEQALADPAGGREERKRFALANTWDDRASQLDALVTKLLAAREETTQAPADAALPTPVSAR